MPTTFSKQMQRIVLEYQAAGNQWPASAKDIASWAIQNRHWSIQPSTAIRACARDIARAMREEYITDAKGRRVRPKHSVTRTRGDEQTNIWDDIRTAPRSHMQAAFGQRRNQIVGDCRQLKADVDSYNDAHEGDFPIQLSLDFTRDIAELEAMANLSSVA